MQRRMLPMITALLAVAASLALGAVGTASAGTPAPQAAAADAARGGGGGGGGVTPNSKLPQEIQVTDPSLTVVATLRGVGKQVYKCTNGAPVSPPEPVATLEELRGSKRIVGIHGAGPFWASLDGSKVARSGDVVAAKPPAGSPPGVDWLKVPVTSQLGAGVFSKVVFVQRIDTRGGLAPTSCTGSAVAVDYSTNYVFWATK